MGILSAISSLFSGRAAAVPLSQAERDAVRLEEAKKWLEAHQVGVPKAQSKFELSDRPHPLDEVFDIDNAHLPHNIFNKDSH